MNERSRSVKHINDIQLQILNATEKLLADEGLHQLSVRKVVRVSGQATGTIYRYFKNKNEMVRALHRRNNKMLADYLFRQYDDSKPTKDRFLFFWHQTWKFGIDNPKMMLCKPEFEKLPPSLQKEDVLESERIFEPIGILFVQGIQQGIFVDLPLPILATLTFEACANSLRRVILEQITLNETQINLLANACFNAIEKS
jgi:TetR/AcrR family transcriptional repressor of multidrug resistance operon